MRLLRSRTIIGVAVAITIASVVVWQATGGDYFTKYEVVEQVESELDADDPLAAAGFYEGRTQTQTVTRQEFRFGLLPTAQGIYDKHAISVVSITAPSWIFAVGLIWWARRRKLRRR